MKSGMKAKIQIKECGTIQYKNGANCQSDNLLLKYVCKNSNYSSRVLNISNLRFF